MSVFPSFLLPNSRRIIRLGGGLVIAVVGAIALLTAGFVIEASAQSGRRNPAQPTASPTASPTPSPLASTEAPNAKAAKPPATDEPQHKLRLLFARQPTSKHLLNEDVIAASFFKRLTQYANVDCLAIGDLKEKQAVARAKSETEAVVVLLRFDINSYQSGTVILNSPDLEIEYFALAPRTGKKYAKGKIYFQTIGGGRMQRSGWPNGTPIRITPEGAGIEAAETLYQLLSIKTANKPRP